MKFENIPIFPAKLEPPTKPGGRYNKRPLFKWRDRARRKPASEWEGQWPEDANLAGFVPADMGWVVIDLDHGCDLDWVKANLPATRTHRSVSGASHYIYACEENFGNGRLAAHIDVRSAAGWVPWPEYSIGYQVVDDHEPVPLPAAIRAQLRWSPSSGESADYADDDAPEWVEQAQAWLSRQPADVDGWFIAASLIRNFGLTDETTERLWNEWQADFGYQWDEGEMAKRIASARAASDTKRGEGVAFSLPTADSPMTPAVEEFAAQLAAERKMKAHARFPHHDPEEDSRLPPLEYLDEDHLLPKVPGGCVVLVVGPKSSHKTGLAMKKCFDAMQAGRHVLYIPTEGAHGIRKARVPAYRAEWGMSWGELRERWRVVPERFNLLNPADDGALLDSYGEWGVDVLVIDVLVKATPGADQNDARAVAQIIVIADEMAASFDATVILTLHPPKGAKGGAAGSHMFGDLAFAEWHVSKAAGGIKVWVDKMKDGPAEFQVHYALKEGSPPIVTTRIPEAEIQRRSVHATGPDPMVETIRAILSDQIPRDTKALVSDINATGKHNGIEDKSRLIWKMCQNGELPGMFKVLGEGRRMRYLFQAAPE